MALVTLRSYRDPIAAELAKTQLESAGIPAVLADQHLVGVQWLYSIAIGGVKVRVDESDLSRAREVLRENHSAELAGIPESVVPPPTEDDECPICASPDVESSQAYRVAAALSLWSGIPIPIGRNRWVCRACGHAWKRQPDSGAEVPYVTLAAERAVHESRSYPRAVLAVLVAIAVLYYLYFRIRVDAAP